MSFTDVELQIIMRNGSYFRATDFYLAGRKLTELEVKNLGICVIEGF